MTRRWLGVRAIMGLYGLYMRCVSHGAVSPQLVSFNR